MITHGSLSCIGSRTDPRRNTRGVQLIMKLPCLQGKSAVITAGSLSCIGTRTDLKRYTRGVQLIMKFSLSTG